MNSTNSNILSGTLRAEGPLLPPPLAPRAKVPSSDMGTCGQVEVTGGRGRGRDAGPAAPVAVGLAGYLWGWGSGRRCRGGGGRGRRGAAGSTSRGACSRSSAASSFAASYSSRQVGTGTMAVGAPRVRRPSALPVMAPQRRVPGSNVPPGSPACGPRAPRMRPAERGVFVFNLT